MTTDIEVQSTAATDTTTKHSARILDLGEVDYQKALEIQHRLVEKRIAGGIEDSFLFCTHPPTITVGRSGRAENLLVSDDELARRGIKKFEIERGGDVTFHGPGQQLIYPILDLNARGRDVHRFVRDLEQVVIEFLRHYDLVGVSLPGKTGVWVGDKKICAIGIAVRRWVTFHGLALNLDTDLSYFQIINPCGFSSDTVTSLARFIGRGVDRPAVFYQLTIAVERVFGAVLKL